jgi:hypothetical protein
VPDSLSDKELEQRLPVWCALAALFLDTELQSTDFNRIAMVISEAGLSAGEAEKILKEEVAPVFTPNVVSVAGEWAGWSEEFVRESILANLSTATALRAGARFRARHHRTLYVDAWKEVARRLTQNEHSR